MFGIGMQELLLILVVVLLIFGANKLPEIGAGWVGPSATSAVPRRSRTKSTSPPRTKKRPVTTTTTPATKPDHTVLQRIAP